MQPRPYELFISYSRRDNVPSGWVTEFVAQLKQRHAQYSGRELNPFFDQLSIDEGSDWRRRLGAGLRQSRLFLAFLSPNYITSRNCLWEWDEYLRREHSAARGDDGLTPVFFVQPADLQIDEHKALADWLAEMERKYPWFQASPGQLTAESERLARPFVRDLHRRHRTLDVQLQQWFPLGPRLLRELDAAARSEQARTDSRQPAEDLRTLAERLERLDQHIARRLDRIALADLAPGNIPRSYEHFVGRHRELSELHDIMLTGGPQTGGRGMGGRGMIAAAFSPGGLGKTALARQYAHAYAEFYAAGGTWEVACEGLTEIGEVLLRLADQPSFARAAVSHFDQHSQQEKLVAERLALTDEQRGNYALAAQAILEYLHRVTQGRVEVLRRQLRELPERHCPADEPPELQTPRALLILDNVDRPELLSAAQIEQLPAAEWFEVIVTTRLDPDRFGGGQRVFRPVEVSVLPTADAVRLLADFQPAFRFADAAQEQAARQIALALGGYTLAVELVGAYLGDLAKDGYQPADYLPRLEAEGLTSVDELAGEEAVRQQIRHSQEVAQNHIGTLVGLSVARLSAPARTALEFASLLMPDEIPLAWVEALTRARHEDELREEPHGPAKWAGVWRELHGLRLLHPARELAPDERGVAKLPETVRIHRLVAEHVAKAAGDTGMFAELDRFLFDLSGQFEHQVGQSDDEHLRQQHPWLRDQLEHLIKSPRPTPELLRSTQVAADFEGEHGSLVRALEMTRRILTAKEQLLRDNPQSAQAARDVSVSLNKLADFLARRGQPGDATQALEHYQRSLEVREQLLRDNPQSAQAARDVSVS
ncbi:MAG: toll/interleukin-1 receptor domain-containing protein, partial [Pirellulaceae bacterium]|nr:toll/interleukin-1 receptor domain-containing protein [Pirellulaceae bacterium]